MLSTVSAEKFTIRGVSVGGIYTSLFVPELSALFDVGIPARSSAVADYIFISHAHVDHLGAMASLLYGVDAGDGATFVVAALGLLVIAAAATLWPAWAATRIDPLSCLRSE